MGIMGIPTITHYNLAFLSIARASAICAEKSILSLPLLTLSALFTKRTASSPVNVGITFISNAIVLYIYLGAKLLLIFQIAKLFLVFLWSPMSNTGQRCINSLIIGAGLHILCYAAIAVLYGISNEIIFYSYKTYQNEYQSLFKF